MGRRESSSFGNVTKLVKTTGVRATALVPAYNTYVFQLDFSNSGNYLLWCRYSGTPATLSYSGPSGSGTITPGPPDSDNYFHFNLTGGEYQFSAAADGDSPIYIDWDLLLLNGVGQNLSQSPSLSTPPVTIAAGSAYLPSPTGATASAFPSASAIPVVLPSSSVGAAPSLLGVTAAAPTIQAIAPSEALALVNSDVSPVGRPNLDAEHIEVVGPTIPGGSFPLAYASNGLPPGYATHGAEEQRGEDASLESVDSALKQDLDARRRADETALARSVWVDRLLSLVTSQSTKPPENAYVSSPEAGAAMRVETSEPVVGTASEEGAGPGSTLGRAACLIPLAALAIRYRFRTRLLPAAIAFNEALPPSRHQADDSLSRRRDDRPRWQRDLSDNGSGLTREPVPATPAASCGGERRDGLRGIDHRFIEKIAREKRERRNGPASIRFRTRADATRVATGAAG